MLPLNINGDPEYATVVLTLHRGGPVPSANAHVCLTCEKSTRSPEEEVAALASVNGDAALRYTATHCRLLADGAHIDAVYVYRPAGDRGAVHVVIGSGAYRELIDAPEFGRGSNLVADQKLFAEIAAEEAAEGRKALRMLRVDDLLEEALQAA